MEVYRVGDSTKCIVWNYHIMGFNGGRARQLVDMIASKGKRQGKPAIKANFKGETYYFS